MLPPTKVLFMSSPLVFSKPHTREGEEEGQGRDLALYESKQKSASTRNNKSIQKKKKSNVSLGGRASNSEQLLATTNFCPVATRQRHRLHQPDDRENYPLE